LSYYSDEKYPKDQLIKINKLIAEEEKKRLEEEDRIKNRDKYYREAIARGNAANELRKYQEAITEYEAALDLKPEEVYPAEKIKEIKAKLELAQKIEDEKATLIEESKKEPEGISMEKERILSELALEYPEGLTEETYMDGQKKIVRRIVVKYGRADDYKMVVQPWGAKFYFKNDKSIPSHLFALETDVD
jgi:tetratricopeptide (TPR) repeat protein